MSEVRDPDAPDGPPEKGEPPKGPDKGGPPEKGTPPITPQPEKGSPPEPGEPASS
jgi:hypothetical protein